MIIPRDMGRTLFVAITIVVLGLAALAGSIFDAEAREPCSRGGPPAASAAVEAAPHIHAAAARCA